MVSVPIMKNDSNLAVVELALANYNYAVKVKGEEEITRHNHILLTGVNAYNCMSKSKIIAFNGTKIFEIGKVNGQ